MARLVALILALAFMAMAYPTKLLAKQQPDPSFTKKDSPACKENEQLTQIVQSEKQDKLRRNAVYVLEAVRENGEKCVSRIPLKRRGFLWWRKSWTPAEPKSSKAPKGPTRKRRTLLIS